MDYLEFGSGKKTLVILPGLSVQSVLLSAEAIEKAYSPLANLFTVYVFDRRRELPPSYSIDEMANDTADALAAAGIVVACIFGASQGAMMAIKIAARRPELVEKLVLASAAERITDNDCALFEKWIEFAREGDAKKLYFAFGETIYPQAVLKELSAFLVDSSRNVTRDDLRRFIILAKAANGFDATLDLEKIACPTLVIGDTDDRVFGIKAAYAIFDRVKHNPGAELYVYHGYGHAVYDTAPDFKERILRFLM